MPEKWKRVLESTSVQEDESTIACHGGPQTASWFVTSVPGIMRPPVFPDIATYQVNKAEQLFKVCVTAR